MAEPIKAIKFTESPSKTEVIGADMEEIAEVLSNHKEAVIEGVELLGALHESGTLEMLTALLKQREAALDNILGELNKEQYTGMLENIGDLLFLVGDLNVQETREILNRVNSGMTEAIETAESTEENRTTYMDLIKSLKDPEINRSVTMLLQFLKGMGRT